MDNAVSELVNQWVAAEKMGGSEKWGRELKENEVASI